MVVLGILSASSAYAQPSGSGSSAPAIAVTAPDVAGSSAPALAAAAPDFVAIGYLDAAVTRDGATVISRAAGPLVLLGWVFECRSGLQPVSQRIGSFSVIFRRGTEQWLPPNYSLKASGVAREDVAAALAPMCPAVGPYVGYEVETDVPPPGDWTVSIAWATWDGALRVILNHVSRSITVVK